MGRCMGAHLRLRGPLLRLLVALGHLLVLLLDDRPVVGAVHLVRVRVRVRVRARVRAG